VKTALAFDADSKPIVFFSTPLPAGRAGKYNLSDRVGFAGGRFLKADIQPAARARLYGNRCSWSVGRRTAVDLRPHEFYESLLAPGQNAGRATPGRHATGKGFRRTCRWLSDTIFNGSRGPVAVPAAPDRQAAIENIAFCLLRRRLLLLLAVEVAALWLIDLLSSLFGFLS